MGEFFHFQDSGEEREDGFDDHALVPSSLIADFEIVRIAVFGFEAFVGQHDHFVLPLFDQRMKGCVMNIGSVHVKANDSPVMVGHNGELGSHDPAMIAQALARYLALRSFLAPGMHQFNAVGVSKQEQVNLEV